MTQQPCAGPHVFLWLLLAVASLSSGCGSGPKSYPVSGTVTLDGQPLAEGDIYFHSTDPALGTDAGKIIDGRFQFRAKAGKKRVEIRASRAIPGQKTPMGSPLRLEYIPAAYNDESTLSADVTSDGKNEYEFPLEGKRS